MTSLAEVCSSPAKGAPTPPSLLRGLWGMRYRFLIKFNPTAARVYIHIYEYGDGKDPIRMFV